MNTKKNKTEKSQKLLTKKRGRKIMKLTLLIIGFLFIAALCFLGYKLIQLKKLDKMSLEDMLTSVTEDSGSFVSIALIENGQVSYYFYGDSKNSEDSLSYDYEIGSISKTMAALLTSKAVADGKLSLSDSISDYLDLPKKDYYPTIDRLLTHTSGYKPYYLESEMISNELHGENSFYRVSKDKLLKRVGSVSLKDKDYPFEYSNFGISVLGLVLEAVYQEDYTTLLTNYLKSELLMNATTVATGDGNLSKYWHWGKKDGYIPAGAVISNITDMAKYLDFCMTSEEPYVTEVFEAIKTVNYTSIMYKNLGICIDKAAMAWLHDDSHQLIWHNGGTSNYNSYIAMTKDKTRGVVILSNYGPDKNIPVTVIGAKLMQDKLVPLAQIEAAK